jgi:hypothetical protein
LVDGYSSVDYGTHCRKLLVLTGWSCAFGIPTTTANIMKEALGSALFSLLAREGIAFREPMDYRLDVGNFRLPDLCGQFGLFSGK